MITTTLYHHYLDMRNEIEKHKWIESEKIGYDVGFEHALIDWTSKHRKKWIRSVYEKTSGKKQS